MRRSNAESHLRWSGVVLRLLGSLFVTPCSIRSATNCATNCPMSVGRFGSTVAVLHRALSTVPMRSALSCEVSSTTGLLVTDVGDCTLRSDIDLAMACRPISTLVGYSGLGDPSCGPCQWAVW